MRRRGHVTISSVAASAGVSKATVSRVMNGLPTVDPDLVRRVRTAAEHLGYQPNAVAQNLSRGQTGVVGVLVPDLANPLFTLILKGIAFEAADDGYHTLVADTNERSADEPTRATELARQSDGLILCGPRMTGQALTDLRDIGKPIVVVNRRPSRGQFPAVWVDSREAIAALCQHLHELGHRRVAYLAGPEHSAANAERWTSLRSSLPRRLSLTQVPAGAMMADGYAAADAALATDATCLVGYNDLVALGAMTRLHELDIHVPGRVSVAGIDDIVFARYTSPSLTTIAVPQVDFGREAWRLLSPYLHGRKGRRTRALRAHLVTRDSTGPAPPAGQNAQMVKRTIRSPRGTS
jgi:LacI family transcriptional regulator